MRSTKPWTVFTLALVGLVLASGSSVVSAQMPQQQQRPDQRPPRPEQPPDALPPPPGANICTTQWGWCQLPTISAPPGIGCACLTADEQQVWGTTRYFPYSGPASPYLQPHSGPPSTIP